MTFTIPAWFFWLTALVVIVTVCILAVFGAFVIFKVDRWLNWSETRFPMNK